MLKKLYSSLSFWEAIARGCNWLLLASLPFFLTENTYGTIVILSSYLLLISNVGVVGQNKVILRYVDEKNNSYLPYNIIISTFTTIIVFSITLYFFEIKESYIFQLLIATLLFTNYSLYIAYARKSFGSYRYAKIRFGYSLTRLVIGLTLIVIYQEPIYYLYAEIFALLIGFLISKPSFASLFKRRLSVRDSVCIKSLKFGVPLIIHSLAVFGLAFSDRLILSLYLTSDAVGRYAALYTYAASLSFIYAILAVTWEPRIYRAISCSDAENIANNFLRKCLTYGSTVGVVIFIFYYSIFIKFKGTDTSTILPFLLILAGHLVIPFYFKMNYLLAKAEKTALISLSSVIAGVCNILLNLYLVPIYGILGAAITTLLSYILLFVMTLYFYNKE